MGPLLLWVKAELERGRESYLDSGATQKNRCGGCVGSSIREAKIDTYLVSGNRLGLVKYRVYDDSSSRRSALFGDCGFLLIDLGRLWPLSLQQQYRDFLLLVVT